MSNILFNAAGKPLISDFGLGIRLDDSLPRISASDQRPGNRDYMAPEQLDDPLNIDHRSDIYALGIILLEYFTATTNPHIGLARLQNEPLKQFILKCIAVNKEDRFQSITVMKNTFASITEQGVVYSLMANALYEDKISEYEFKAFLLRNISNIYVCKDAILWCPIEIIRSIYHLNLDSFFHLVENFLSLTKYNSIGMTWGDSFIRRCLLISQEINDWKCTTILSRACIWIYYNLRYSALHEIREKLLVQQIAFGERQHECIPFSFMNKLASEILEESPANLVQALRKLARSQPVVNNLIQKIDNLS